MKQLPMPEPLDLPAAFAGPSGDYIPPWWLIAFDYGMAELEAKKIAKDAA